MFSHIVTSRRHFIVLIVGVIIGFGCTYFIENLYQVEDEELTTQYTPTLTLTNLLKCMLLFCHGDWLNLFSKSIPSTLEMAF